MTNENQQGGTELKAVIYCRVSSKKQKLEGGGLESQEQRCRAYAEDRGYEVEAVFPDDASGGGDFMKRPGMVALLSYLDAQPSKNYVVIFDDLKRFARQTEMHIKLRQAFEARGAKVACLNFKFEDTPEGKFIETIIAAQGELEREQNRRQVVQKMKARVENGFWVFRAPVGYKYIAGKGSGGKVLVPDEPVATTVREALEGFASGRFASQAEVQRFFERCPHFPKDLPDGRLRPMTVSRLLKKVVYAGYVEAPKWDISLRKGEHEGLISFETFERVQEALEGRARPAARRDFNEDFPLRGYVACNSCGNAMTSAWSKGCRKHYAYYRCMTRGCPEKNKSIKQATIEDGFADILKSMQPTKKLFALARVMLEDAWNARLKSVVAAQDEVKRQLKGVEKQMESLLDRIVGADNPTVIGAYETRLAKLEREKFVLAEKAASAVPPKGRLGECIELALEFLSNPWNIYKNGDYATRQTVLRLAFQEPIPYCRNKGYGTPKISFPFKVFEGISGLKREMVPQGRIELPTSPLPRVRSTTELLRRLTVGG